jgi:hypothetical protein
MKRTRRRITNPELSRRALYLSQETIRNLSSADLAQAAAGVGCDTTSLTTEHTDSNTQVGCANTFNCK